MKSQPATNYVIRPGAPDDAQGIAAVHVSTWRHAYKDIVPAQHLANLDEIARAEKWKKMLMARSPHVLVARVGEAIVGWIAFGSSRDEELDASCAEVQAIYMASPFWGQGIGTALMNSACEKLVEEGYAAVVLWVLEDNLAARSFYHRRGFTSDGAAKVVDIGGASLTEVRLKLEIASSSATRSLMR
jgi:ribosomal protein S18 acetylase RimI-like enzyme